MRGLDRAAPAISLRWRRPSWSGRNSCRSRHHHRRVRPRRHQPSVRADAQR